MAITVYAALQAGIKVKAPKPPSPYRRQVGLDDDQVEEKKANLRNDCPSEYWVDTHFQKHYDFSPDGERMEYRTFHRKAFPPKGSTMCRCRKCLAQGENEPGIAPLTPPDFHVGEAVCVDHLPDYINEGFGPSPSGRAIAELEYRNLRLEETRLPSDTTSSLRREIRRYLDGKSPLARKLVGNAIEREAREIFATTHALRIITLPEGVEPTIAQRLVCLLAGRTREQWVNQEFYAVVRRASRRNGINAFSLVRQFMEHCFAELAIDACFPHGVKIKASHLAAQTDLIPIYSRMPA